MRFRMFEKGASLVGYGLVLGLIGVVALGAIPSAGQGINGLFTQAGSALAEAGLTAAATPAPVPTPTPPLARASCRAWAAAGETADGDYLVDPGGGADPVTVRCDMSADGGGWMLASDYDIAAAAYDFGLASLQPFIDANIIGLEVRYELHTSSRVYRTYRQNTRLQGMDHYGLPAYFARCKQSWGDSWSGDDWGVDTSLINRFGNSHNEATNAGSGNWRYNVMTACHNTIRADDGSAYVAQFNTYFAPTWNAYCGGMRLFTDNVYSVGCGYGHGFSQQGPENSENFYNYGRMVLDRRRVRVWIREGS